MYLLWAAAIATFVGLILGWFGITLVLLSAVWAVAVARKFSGGSTKRFSFWPVAIVFLTLFWWGCRHRGAFRIPVLTAGLRVVALGSDWVWREKTLVLEDVRGQVLVSVDPRRFSGADLPDGGITRCGRARWLRASSCDGGAGGAPGATRPVRKFASKIRRAWMGYMDRFGPLVAKWFRTLLLGIPANEKGGIVDVFRATGLLHFVVVSGAHVTLVHKIFIRTVSGPLNLLTAFCPWIPVIRRTRDRLSALLAVLPTLLFCIIAGLDPPVQRAICSLVVFEVAALAACELPVTSVIATTFVLQAMLWPAGFVSRSNLLSWVAWLTVVLARPAFFSWSTAARSCVLQVSLAAGMAVAGGIACSAGIVANLLFLPFLEGFFLLSVVICALGPAFAEWIGMESMVRVIVDIATWFSLIATNPFFTGIDAFMLRPTVRVTTAAAGWAVFCYYAASTLVASRGPDEPAG